MMEAVQFTVCSPAADITSGLSAACPVDAQFLPSHEKHTFTVGPGFAETPGEGGFTGQ